MTKHLKCSSAPFCLKDGMKLNMKCGINTRWMKALMTAAAICGTDRKKDARVMNSIIANLELCDWSIVQIFDNLARDQYLKKNWENAIRSKYRLKITQDELKPEVRKYFDEHPEVIEKFWGVSKQQLVNILLNKKYQKVLSPNRVIYLINKELVNDEFISSQLDREQFGRVLNKEVKQEIKPLVSDVVFDQTIQIGADGFEKASEIIYEWAYQHIAQIFWTDAKEKGIRFLRSDGI